MTCSNFLWNVLYRYIVLTLYLIWKLTDTEIFGIVNYSCKSNNVHHMFNNICFQCGNVLTVTLIIPLFTASSLLLFEVFQNFPRTKSCFVHYHLWPMFKLHFWAGAVSTNEVEWHQNLTLVCVHTFFVEAVLLYWRQLLVSIVLI